MNGVQHKAVGVAWGAAAAIYTVKHGDPMGIIYALTAGAGSMFPDIDHNQTKLGRERKKVVDLSKKGVKIAAIVAIVVILASLAGFGLNLAAYGINSKYALLIIFAIILMGLGSKALSNSSTVKWMCKHRGLMHTLIPPAMILLLNFATEAPVFHYVVNGFVLGYLSHLFADCCNKEGVPLFWPIIRSNFQIMAVPTKEVRVCSIICAIIGVIPIMIAILLP